MHLSVPPSATLHWEFNNLPPPPPIALFMFRLSFFHFICHRDLLVSFFFGGGGYGGLLERQGRDLLHVAITVYQYTVYI